MNGEPLAQIDIGEVLSYLHISYLHTDHLGTPRYATNTSGAQVWNWSSDAFGNGAPSGTATVNLRFAGQYWDNESGLHYNWNRYYDPATGRYISSDPIGLAGGLNTYGYALANPLMFTDPEGLASKGSGSSVPLSGGYTARVDIFPNGHGTDFEIHIYDKSGKEVGVLGSKGWIPKHGHSGAVPDIPQTVLDSAKGVWAKEARRHEMLPKKGFGSIKSEALDRIFKRAKGLSKICPPLIILDGVLGAEDTKKILEGDQGTLCDWFPGYCDPGWL